MDIQNIQYTEEQLNLINEELQKCEERERESNGWVQYPRSDAIRQRGEQIFAIFGNYAYDLTQLPPETIYHNDEGELIDHVEYLPVIINGQAVRQEPDEGNCGTLCLMKVHCAGGRKRSGKWMTSFIKTGWLRAKELVWTDKEISQQIQNEIMAGENHITGYKDLG